MPIDNPELRGTEWDGSMSYDYCKYCYQKGEFTRPGLTLDEMKSHMMELMDNQNLPDHTIQEGLKRLPHLLRWVGQDVRV
jgi:hypothetical protein